MILHIDDHNNSLIRPKHLFKHLLMSSKLKLIEDKLDESWILLSL